MIGALLAALALLAIAAFAPMHAASHVGERFGGAAHATLEAAVGDRHAPSEHGGPPCDLCLVCIGAAFASAPGSDGPPIPSPPAASDASCNAPFAAASARAAWRERPEPRGPPQRP